MHNILQGVADPDQRLSKEEMTTITEWIQDNAKRYWFSEGGPLRPPEEGGAHVIMVSLRFLTPLLAGHEKSHRPFRSNVVLD